MNKRKTIESFFNKASKIPRVEEEQVLDATPTVPNSIADNEISITEVSSVNPESVFKNDIGAFLGKTVNDYMKKELLENHWKPSPNYSFPYSRQKQNTKDGKPKEIKRFLSAHHLTSFHWIVYSDICKGLFCKYCFLFSREKVGHNQGVLSKTFATTPLINFKKLTGKDSELAYHDRNQYHKECVENGKAFLIAYRYPESEVINKVNRHRLNVVKENRARLRPIVETIIFMGRQNMPLRGHRDDATITESVHNEGNFRELLRFRAESGDTTLKNHLKNAEGNAMYTSKTIQNALIECCSDEIKDIIVRRIKDAKFFSIIFDGTTDVSHVEQLTLNVRYLNEGRIREDFVGFLDAYKSVRNSELQTNSEPKLTGVCLSDIVINYIKDLSLNLENLVGIGTDNCSVMSSDSSGAVAKIIEVAYNAIRNPCYSHMLNNSVSKSAHVPAVRNAIGVIKSTCNFFKQSAKRNCILRENLGGQLTSLCETRWVERHESFVKFQSALPGIIDALGIISAWEDSSTSSSAATLINSLCSAEFIMVLISATDIYALTLPLSRILQKETLDLKRASSAVSNTLEALEKRRKDADTIFARLHGEAEHLANQLGIEMRLPRLASRQCHRENYPANNTESYYRRMIYIPIIDNIISDMKVRFPSETLECFELRNLLPDVIKCSKETEAEQLKWVKNISKKYHKLLKSEESVFFNILNGELNIWREFVMKENLEEHRVVEALEKCDEDMFPSIHALLRILATLPVSVATAERTFSTLRRVKTWIRSRTKEDRLTGLCLLNIHRDCNIDPEKVIDRFAKSGNRRKEFIL